MSEEIRHDVRRKVTSVGNSWVVCKSKSHPGHVFYFNSFTGETAWNLSDAEIEKAKNRTNHLEHLPGAKPVKCPEPKEKPPLKKDSEPVWSLSSEQLDNNKNSEQQSSDITNSNIANSNSPSSTPSMQSTQVYNPAPIEPVFNLNSYNTRLNTYNVNNTSMVYNPKIWAVPQTQQLFISPGLATVENYSPGPLNVAYNQTVSQPVTGHVFNRFNNPTWPATPGMQSFYPRYFKHDKGTKSPKRNKFRFTKQNDLRQKLSFKKRTIHTTSSIPGGSGFFNTNPKNADIAANIAKNVEGINSNDFNAGMERCVETQLQETPSRIDVGPLKSLAPSNSNSDAWFIVVDLEVLLNEFKFLTTLTDSDEKCYLMVPKRVMEELKSYVNCTKNIQAKRILRFLSHQIEIGYAYLADEPSKLEGDGMAEAILTTCKDLLAINYHLILLTNDNHLLTKSSTNIKMFSVNEINKLLMVIPNKQLVLPGPKKPYMSNDLINKIKITVPNDATKNIDITTPVRDNQSDDHIDNIPFTTPKQETTEDKTEQLTILKKTVDTGIQTDLEDINASISLTNMIEKQHLNADSNLPPQNRNEAITGPPVSVVSNIPEKKREIKLKRSVSHLPLVNSAKSEKKQFKWRRKPNTSLQVNQDVPSHNEQKRKKKNVESVQTNTLNNEICNISDKTLYNNVTLGCPENKNFDDGMESRDSSIYAEPRNSTTKENVTIDETSTSGVISNTESNVDADSNASNTTNSINQQSNCIEQFNKAMYEVDSITMEQYLKTKCDEWISRFIQIMEEVLTQVLLQDPPFTNNAMPPPWTLHEAAQCVVIKFCGHQNIITAAKNLSEILWQVSDAKGHITMNMTPCQYMQMYSYGIHLLDAITVVINSCEDIQIAVDLLKKLLYDIQNQNMDSNDDFNDNELNNVSADSDTPNVSDESSLQEIVKNISDCSPVKEVPNDKKSIPPEEELQKPVKFIRNFGLPISSIENLGRQRISPGQSREEQHLTPSQIRKGNTPQNTNETIEKGTDCDLPTHEPNDKRKSTKFPRLVEKLSREEQHLTHSQIREGHNAQIANETTETNIIRKFTTFPMFEEKLSLEEKLPRKDKLLLEQKPFRKDKLSLEEKLSEEEKLSREDKLSRKETLSQEEKQYPEEQYLTYSQISEGNNPQNANETAEKGIDSVAPTIIRKFTTFPEFEEKLKSNFELLLYEDHDSELGYNESNVDYITDDDCLDDENYNEQRLDVIDHQTEVGPITNDAYEPEEADTNEAYETTNLEDDSLLCNENTKKFKYMMYMLLREIKNALNQVRVLCDQCYKELENPEVSTELKYQLRKKAERAHLDTLQLCRSLESMLNNETYNPTQSMSDYLEEADINIRHVDANLLLKYRTTVAKCKDHANEFLSSIRNIISDTKR